MTPRRALSFPARALPLLPTLASAVAVTVLALSASAAPASAQTSVTLVSNTGQSSLGFSTFSSWDATTNFTTGSNSFGYRLTGLDLQLGQVTLSTASFRVIIDRANATCSSARKDAATQLTKPATLINGINTFTAPGAGIDLAPNTTYRVVFDVTVADTLGFVAVTGSDGEDSGGATGWSIADDGCNRNSSHNADGHWSTNNDVLKLAIKGYAKTTADAPQRPRAPVVTTGSTSGSLSVSWLVPPTTAAVTDYDLRYFKGSTDPDSESDWVTEGVVGLPHPDTAFTATEYTIKGLLANTAYQVQVRAANANGEGPWSTSGSRTTAMAPGTNNAPRVLEEKTGDANNRCQVKTNTSTPTRTIVTPSNTQAGFSPFVVRGSETTEWPATCTDSNVGDRQVPVFDDRDAEQLLLTIDYTLPAGVRTWPNFPQLAQPDAQPGAGDDGESQGQLHFRAFAALDTTDVRIDVTATDPHGASASTHVIFKMIPSSSQRAPSLPAVGGQRYAVNQAIADLVLPAATGGDTVVVSGVLIPSYFYTVSGLPPGLSFNKSTRTISGTPTTAGSYTVTYQADDTDVADASDGNLSDTAVQTFQILVEGNGPVIQSLGIVSFPSLDRSGSDGVADTYGLGETIAVEVEFTEDVVVTGDNSAVRLRLDLGADDATLTDSRKVLNLHSHEGNTLRFEYTVASGDTDADGVWVQTASATNDRVVFLTGSATIKDADDNDAVLTKSGLSTSGDANQKVDASFAPLPKFESAEVNYKKLTITFTGKLATANAPAASAFTVSGTFSDPSSVAFSADSTQVILTLNLPVQRDETGITVSYAKPSANPLQVPATWQLANFSNRPVRNVRPPRVGGGTVNGTAVELTFDGELNASKTPSPTRFTVSGPTVTTTVTAVAVSSVDATVLNLTVSPKVTAADTGTISVAYEAGTDANPLQDANGNKVADFTEELSNVTPPAVTGASVNRDVLTLAFDDRLHSGEGFVHSPPDVSRFTVSGTAAGATVTRVVIPNPRFFEPGENTEVELTLSARVEIGETGVTVSYAAGDDVNPLKGDRGKISVADFTQDVTNATQPPAVIRPYVGSSPSIDANSDNTAETYGLGEVIRVGVGFDEDVTVDVSGGTPRLRIDLKSGSGGERWASYEGIGVDLWQQIFAYTVTAADTSTAGIAVLENTLELNGGAIRSAVAAVTTNATLAHPGLAHDADHKVDGSRTTSAPVLWEGALNRVGTVDGLTLTVSFNKALDAMSAPAGSAFTVRVRPVGTGQQPYTISGTGTASISGATVTVTLASAVPGFSHAVAELDVSYAKPSANPLQGLGGGEVAAFSNERVSNLTPRGTPGFPTTTSTLSVRENSAAGTLVGTVTATDPNDDPLTYTLTSTASGGTDHRSFAIDANTGQITVAPGATLNYAASYAVTVTASDGTFSADHLLTIRVTRAPTTTSPPSAPRAPTVTPASATSLTVTWSAPSDLGSATVIQDYDLRYYAGSADPTNPSDWIEEGEANGPPNPGASTSAVLSGLAQNTAYVVQVRGQGDGESPWSPSGGATTRAPAADPPTNGAVSADGATVTLEFAEALDATSVPAPDDFTVTLAPASSAVAASSASSEASSGGPSASTSSSAAQHRVTAVAIRGSALDLTVAPPVPAGREAVVSYTKGSAPLRTASGAEVPGFGFTATAPAAPPPPPSPPPTPTPAIAVTVEGGSALEGTAVEFTARLSQAADSDVVLGWSTGPDDSPGARPATPDVDYRPVVDGRVTVAAGSTEAMFSVATLADFDEEGDETFAVTVTGIGLPEGVTVTAATAVGTIEDDVLLPPPVQDTISVEGGTAVEGEPVTFTVRLSSAVGSDVVLRWFTSADHAHGAQRATADEDYTAVRDGRVRIVAGLTEATFAVATAADTLEEGDETFRVIITELEVPEGAGIVHSTALGTIENYTPPPNEAPSFELSEYAFELEENTDGSAQSVRLGAVSATDPDGDELTYALAAGDSTRFAVGVRNGAVLYVGPGEDFEAEPNLYELTVRASDPAGESAEAAVTVTVVNVNERPAAADDAATTDEDVAVEIDVLANDTDVEGTALRVSSVSAPSNGTAEVSAAGGVLYTPDANWYGTDSFAYEIDDGDGGTAEASVEVTVVPVNDAPEAAADAASTDEDVAVEIDVLANDTDIDGDSLRVSSVSEAANGTVAVTAGGGVRYTPAANWHGTDAFVYEIDDGAGGTASAEVEVTVLPVNDVPEAFGDAASTDEDAAVEIDVLANDTDADGDSLTVSSVSVPSNGTAEISAGGGVRYTPAANWYGTDAFTYEVDDGNGGTASASVEVTVLPVNDAPEAVDDVASADEDGS
ncbi:MAG: tandem-95 repeat protein, partial [Gemmatimonadetes bacterium]|nr:tandem-95 repeat protein [Gemmatimonadota bacterium]